jgi:hypothetical protein
MNGRSAPHAFPLIELLIVILVIAVLSAIVIPRGDPLGQAQLLAAGEAVAGDLAYARSLAVANDSRYRITFDLPGNRYTLEHSGADSSLNTLPVTAWRRSEDAATQQVTDLDELPRVGAPPRLLAVGAYTNLTAARISALEFGPLGQLMQGKDVVVWLSVNTGGAQGYLPLAISAATGLTTIGQYSGYGPPAALLTSQ